MSSEVPESRETTFELVAIHDEHLESVNKALETLSEMDGVLLRRIESLEQQVALLLETTHSISTAIGNINKTIAILNRR